MMYLPISCFWSHSLASPCVAFLSLSLNSLLVNCDDQVSPIKAALLWITTINSGEYF